MESGTGNKAENNKKADNETINEWLKEFPEIVLTDEQYSGLGSVIYGYGMERFAAGVYEGRETERKIQEPGNSWD